MNEKLEAAKKALGERYVFSPVRQQEISRQKRDALPVLLLALLARKK